ncbi:hypothetical protein BLOT_009402 [Blomia tropicalis]|nr:hypothetical protein BLOT_009402 [Blomia tropicalis]
MIVISLVIWSGICICSVAGNTIVGLHVQPITVDQQQHLPSSSSSSSSSSQDAEPLNGNEIHGTPVAPMSIKPDLYGLINEVNVECNSNDIRITLNAPHPFNGMIYPKGLSKNSSCMAEYTSATNFTYQLPLRACNTMSSEVNEGIEYFNTVIVQPHRRLVTNQGRGYHIRCRYQTREKRITNGLNVSMSTLNREGIEGGSPQTPLTATAPIPTSSMKIFMSDTSNELVAENVKIGDKLSLSITIGEQDIYGMKVTNCLVRDGLNWGEQPLINDEGCPVDKEIMGQFEYTGNLTRAHVSFHAHKFPYTSSVYYQCNVRLCLKDNGGCDDVPPSCDRNGRNYRHRARRDTYDAVVVPTTSGGQYPNLATALASRLASQKGDKDMSMEVYSGLYVDENENTKNGIDDELEDDVDDVSGSVRARKPSESEEFCISMRKFAIGVAIASLLLMFAVILLVVCILQRRRRRNTHRRLYGSSGSTIGSSGSVYSSSGPYTNRAFSRD